MNINNVFAQGSTVDVLLKCAFDMTINGVEYKAGQPYTTFNDAAISIDSRSQEKEVNTRNGIVVGDKNSYIYRLSLGAATWTKKLRDLFFASSSSQINTISSVLNHETTILSQVPTQIWFYVNDVLSTAYTLEDKTFTISDYDNTNIYLLFYSYADSNFVTFQRTIFPYFSAIVNGKGNKDGIGTNFTMIFDKLLLMTDNYFDFNAGTQTFTKITFTVIDPTKTVSIKWN